MRADDLSCDNIRLDLSSRLDGEPTRLSANLLDAHTEFCGTCQAWLDGAQRVTRAIRRPTSNVPDLTARILAALQADGTVGAGTDRHKTPGRIAAITRIGAGAGSTEGVGIDQLGWVGRLRWALGALAVLQLLLALPALLGAAGHDAHTGREVAALQIALSAGLLMTAMYPEHARVFAPVAITLVVCFGAISALDTIEDAVTPARVALHLLTVAQAIVVWQIARAGERPAADA
jgi:predicted anti-sigma-YlaC factor YlaD